MADARSILILDGPTGTELARRGVDVSRREWSARANRDAPDVVQQIHEDYLRAGAGAITTNTFRTHERSLAEGDLAGASSMLINAAVRAAEAARDAVRPDALILGSVGPLEDCYEPQLAPNADVCRREHIQQIRRLLDAGVDRILIETMNNQHEAIAAAQAAQELAPGAWMISFCMHVDSPPGTLLSGEPLADLLPQLDRAAAIGVNCVDATTMTAQVRLLRALVPSEIAIMAYGNVGRPDDDGRWTQQDAVEPKRYAEYAHQWRDAGATIIGGCCGTTPETIRAVVDRLS